jgi:hypothetical protein
MSADFAIYHRDDLLREIANRLAPYDGDYDLDAIADDLRCGDVTKPLTQVRVVTRAQFMDVASRYARDAIPGCQP